jgi:cytochrome c oxidase assembly protein subunit 15
MRLGSSVLVSLLALQVMLGAQIIWTQRSAAMTTGHVLVGALTLATTFWLTWLAHRDVIETRPMIGSVESTTPATASVNQA